VGDCKLYGKIVNFGGKIVSWWGDCK